MTARLRLFVSVVCVAVFVLSVALLYAVSEPPSRRTAVAILPSPVLATPAR